MKKVLLTTTALTMLAGAASAEIAISGSARMAVHSNSTTTSVQNRMRVNFKGSGESDGGLTFGASTRLQTIGGTGGSVQGASVWLSNGTMTLSVGNTSGAIGNTVNVYAVGGCGFTASNAYGSYCANVIDQANSSFVGSSSGGAGPNNVRIDFSLGSANVSVSKLPAGGDTEIAASFALGSANISVGYDNGAAATGGTWLGVNFNAGSANIAVTYLKPTTGAARYIVKTSMAMGSGNVGVFIANDTGGNRWGVNYSQSLGGGATAMFGAHNQTVALNGQAAGTTLVAGVTFGF